MPGPPLLSSPSTAHLDVPAPGAKAFLSLVRLSFPSITNPGPSYLPREVAVWPSHPQSSSPQNVHWLPVLWVLLSGQVARPASLGGTPPAFLPFLSTP